jgi:hypothetical protein
MWVLRIYDTRTDELEREIPLPRFETGQPLSRFGRPPSPYVSNELTYAGIVHLAQRFGLDLDASTDRAFFLDFEAPLEPRPDPPDRKRAVGLSRGGVSGGSI